MNAALTRSCRAPERPKEAHPSGAQPRWQAAPAGSGENALQVGPHLKTPAPASAFREETLSEGLGKMPYFKQQASK